MHALYKQNTDVDVNLCNACMHVREYSQIKVHADFNDERKQHSHIKTKHSLYNDIHYHQGIIIIQYKL